MAVFIDAHAFILAGRLLVGGLFIVGGITHCFVLPTMAGQMTEHGIPFAKPALIAGSLFEIAAGLAVMVGWLVPLAAGSLIVFTIASSCMMMNFWSLSGEKRMAAMDGWTSNLGVIGGLLIVAALA